MVSVEIWPKDKMSFERWILGNVVHLSADLTLLLCTCFLNEARMTFLFSLLLLSLMSTQIAGWNSHYISLILIRMHQPNSFEYLNSLHSLRNWEKSVFLYSLTWKWSMQLEALFFFFWQKIILWIQLSLNYRKKEDL